MGSKRPAVLLVGCAALAGCGSAPTPALARRSANAEAPRREVGRASPKIVEAVRVDAPGFGCVLEDDGRVRCGGGDQFPVVDGLDDVKQLVATTNDEVCARTGAGKVVCLGRAGPPREVPFLAPARALIDGIPCALRDDGSVRCDAWRFDLETIAAREIAGPGGALDVGAIDLGGPAACLVTARGAVVCWGSTNLGWTEHDAMSRTRVRGYTRIVDPPTVIRGPEDALEIRGNCVRTREGKVWVLGLGETKNPLELTLGARTTPEARAVTIAPRSYQGCIARRGDGTAIVLEAGPLFEREPFGVGPIRVTPYPPP